jgi:hypothetical protein
MITIFYFIVSDIEKRQRSFKIGVFTIFMVVAFVAMLYGLIEVAPVALLRLAQD